MNAAGSEVYVEGCDAIVVNYRTAQDLDNFGTSFVGQEYPNRLYVVNVCPTGEDREVAEALIASVPDSKYIEFDDNVGYATAVNTAGALGVREIIVAFNADVVLEAQALQRCCERLLEQDDWGVLGPMQVGEDGRLTHGGIYGTPEQPSFDGNWKIFPTDEHRVIREAVSVAGSAYFMKRKVWDELFRCPEYREAAPSVTGAFLPTPHYYEDMFFSLHAQAHGWKVIYDGTVQITHKWHRASPIGGWAEQQMPVSREIFRRACDVHGMSHE